MALVVATWVRPARAAQRATRRGAAELLLPLISAGADLRDRARPSEGGSAAQGATPLRAIAPATPAFCRLRAPAGAAPGGAPGRHLRAHVGCNRRQPAMLAR
eukprot:10126867-Alexandrium_andersonii.AAC.1